MDVRRSLVEREPELARLRGAVDAAAAGAGSLVVVEGPAGIGKSRLLAAAGEYAAATGVEVLRARGGVLERDVAHGAVRMLLEGPLARLTGTEREAVLSGAAAMALPALAPVGAEAEAPPDRGYTVLHGLFWCISNLADRGPLLLAIDDAHWFDAPSLRFLLYLVRRVADLPVAIVVGARDDETGAEAQLVGQLTLEPEAAVLRPAPLTLAGVSAVLADRMHAAIAPEFGAACHAAVGGNPFLLSELSGALAADGVQPTAAGATGLRAVRAPTLSRAILLRLGRMSPEAMTLATAVAVLGEEVELEHAGALAGLDAVTAADALDRLAAADILDRRLPVNFLHPLVREAVYSEIGPARRAAWHARAAELLTASGAADERAAPHLLSTVPAGLAGTVRALRRASRVALDRGAPDIAARYLRRALSEPPPAEHQAGVLMELSMANYLAGEPPAMITSHLREAIGLIDDPTERAQAWLLLGRGTSMDIGISSGGPILEEGLADVTGADPAMVVRLAAERNAYGLTFAGTVDRVSAIVDALEVPTGTSYGDRLLLCNIAGRRCFAGNDAQATADIAELALSDGQLVMAEGVASNVVAQAIQALRHADRTDAGRRWIDATLEQARHHGLIWATGIAMGMRAFVHLNTGDMVGAEADASHALAVPGLPTVTIPVFSIPLCIALTERGRLEDAEVVVAASGCGPGLPDHLNANPIFWARARLRSAQGRHDEALADLEELAGRCDRVRMHNPGVPWRADMALLMARLGDEDGAARMAAEYGDLARAWGTPRVLGIAARVRGVLAGGDAGVALLREAVAVHARAPSRLEHASSLLALGSALRRAGKRTEAVERLTDALRLARGCGGAAVANAAAEELAVAGARLKRQAFSGTDALTASERRVAGLAADGLSNREIAETLFVTAKTVENHLGRVYMKLGIGSRGEIGVALGEPAPTM